MFHRPVPHFAVGDVQQLGPNVVGFPLATGERRWYIVGCYLAPNNTLMIESVVAALKECPRGVKLLVTEDFNVNLLEPEGRGYRGGCGYGRTGGYVSALPPVPALMVPVQEDVEYDTGGEGGAVPDGLHSGDGSPPLWKCICPGTPSITQTII